MTDRRIAELAGRSPQVISSMKKRYPMQYELLRVGAIEKENPTLQPVKNYSELEEGELYEEIINLTEWIDAYAEQIREASDILADRIGIQ